jgi:hypothetical protein
MIAYITGAVVEVESKPWEMNGNTGIAHSFYLRDPQDTIGSAQRVRVATPDQLPGKGEVLTAKVDIYPQASDFGSPRLRVSLVEVMPQNGQKADGK